ncbi:unnamed protein product [Closterium sp. NIES-53]
MAGPEERIGRGAGGSGEAQAQGQPRDLAMTPMQPSIGPPRDEPMVFGLDKFNGDNFAEWSFRMENLFDHYDLLEVMEGTEKRPENDPEKSPWVRKSAQGYLLLGQALGSSLIRHIKPFQREPENGPKAWAALKGVHAPATAAVAVVLERQMAALRIEEGEAVEEGLWSSLIINLNRDLPLLSLEDVKRAILQKDFRRRELASADGAGAASIGRGYGLGRGRAQGGGRFGSNNFNGGCGSGGYGSDNKSYGRGRGRFDGECHYYHKSGGGVRREHVGTIASAAFSNPTSATGECDWLTLHRRMGHVALPILQQLVKNEMVAGIRVKGEPDEVLGCPTCMQAKFTRYPFSSSEATAKAPLDEVVMDVVDPLKFGAAGAE